MPFCSSCGKQVSNSTETCPQCGASIVATQTGKALSSAQAGENTSGMGKSSVIPPEVKGWNWGAFWWNWIWGIRNRTWIAFLVLIPYFGIVWIFILGAKGKKWAWQNQKWDSIEQFNRSQHRWAKWGLIIFIIQISIIIGVGAWAFIGSFLWPM